MGKNSAMIVRGSWAQFTSEIILFNLIDPWLLYTVYPPVVSTFSSPLLGVAKGIDPHRGIDPYGVVRLTPETAPECDLPLLCPCSIYTKAGSGQ